MQGHDGRQALYAQRQGVEGILSQGMRAFNLRRARYRGLAKTGLQGIATAIALNLDRIGAWFAGRPLAPTLPGLAPSGKRPARARAEEGWNGRHAGSGLSGLSLFVDV